LQPESLKSLRGADGPVLIATGSYGQTIYIYVEVNDRNVVYATSQSYGADDEPRHADRVTLISSNPPYLRETISFAAEAPGKILSYRQTKRLRYSARTHDHGTLARRSRRIPARGEDSKSPPGHPSGARC
jgi:hypothetical protein